MHYNKTGILLSGGMDSMCVAYWKRPDMAFTIDYGQLCAESEIRASKYIANKLGIEHYIISIDCSSLGYGSLIGENSLDISPSEEWWPYRNQLLVTLACMKGISLGLKRLYVGSISTDVAYSDGRKKFYDLLSSTMEYQEGNVKIEMPAFNLNTLELVKVSNISYSLLLHSHSCHRSNNPCMECAGCKKNYSIRQQLNID